MRNVIKNLILFIKLKFLCKVNVYYIIILFINFTYVCKVNK